MSAPWDKKGVGLNPASQIHYIDHLAVVCIMMEIPLLFFEENDLLLGKKYYPGLDAIMNPYSDFSPEYLIQNFDVSFMSDLWDRRTIKEKFYELELKYGKRWRNVHCPHGFSDKGFYLAKCAMEDISLIYGDNMIDQLKYHEVWDSLERYVVTGNYRYTFYKEHRTFYEEIFEREIQSQFAKKQPIILYAPTWMDLEESTSFFSAHHDVLGKLPENYNMIVKLHPRLELDDVVQYYQIIGQYEKKPNVYFLKDYPLVFPLLDHSDIYLGDMSSVGYDFLAFDKPLFFLNKQDRDYKIDRGAYLFRCGTEIKSGQFSDLYSIIQNRLPTDLKDFSEIRQKTWSYTFGKEKTFSDIRNEVIAKLNEP